MSEPLDLEPIKLRSMTCSGGTYPAGFAALDIDTLIAEVERLRELSARALEMAEQNRDSWRECYFALREVIAPTP